MRVLVACEFSGIVRDAFRHSMATTIMREGVKRLQEEAAAGRREV